jgi:hypothetical protein
MEANVGSSTSMPPSKSTKSEMDTLSPGPADTDARHMDENAPRHSDSRPARDNGAGDGPDNSAHTPDAPLAKKPRKKRRKRNITRAKRAGMPRFEPDEQQRHIVSMMAGVKAGRHEIARLILNPRTGKPINERTLEQHFAEELATGNARLKVALSRSFFKLVEECSEHSVLFGMRTILGFDDRNIPAGAAFTVNDGDRTMKIEFIVPGAEHVRQIEALGNHSQHDGRDRPPRRITPSPDDVVIDRVQPSAWKKPRGSFDWS